MNQKKSYGGFLPIDSLGKEYFDAYNANIKRLNASRYAIVDIALYQNYRTLWIPIYLCDSVQVALEKYNIPYKYYNINKSFEPELDGIGADEGIVITNFYGQKDYSFYRRMIDVYHRVIFDNTQCFFENPTLEDDVYNVYSPRKFVGVPDGSYLIANDIPVAKYANGYSEDRAGWLLDSLMNGTESCYDSYLSAENELTNEGIKNMSFFTRNLLGHINYDCIIKKRKENYLLMCDELDNINELTPKQDINSPMVYPLLIESKALRKKLVENKVFVSQWWKKVTLEPNSNDWERYVSQYLIPLPIDQRYDRYDMHVIASFIKKYIRG